MHRILLLILLWSISLGTVATALSVDDTFTSTTTTATFLQRRRYLEQTAEPPSDQESSSSLTPPFTHSVQDYYTDPYDTTSDDDNDDNDGSEISILEQPESSNGSISIVTIIWISVCIAIVVLVSLCIILGTSQRKQRRKRQPPPIPQIQDDESMHVEKTIVLSPTVPSFITKPTALRTTTKDEMTRHIHNDNDIEKGSSNFIVAIPPNNDCTSTTTSLSSDTVGTVDASSMSLSSLS